MRRTRRLLPIALSLLPLSCRGAPPAADPAPAAPGAPSDLGACLPAIVEGLQTDFRRDGRPAPKVFVGEKLYDRMDGESDGFYAYGFVRSAYQIYKAPAPRPGVPPPQIQADLFEMRDAEGGCGIYQFKTWGAEGETAGLGDASIVSPRFLYLWRGRWFLAAEADSDFPRAAFDAIARAVLDGIGRASVLAALPEEGLEAGRRMFFRKRLSFDERFPIGLGEEDVLGLEADGIAGAIGQYEVPGKEPALLAAIFYPEEASAGRAAEALAAAFGSKGFPAAEEAGARYFQDEKEGVAYGILRDGPRLLLLATPDLGATARLLPAARDRARAVRP